MSKRRLCQRQSFLLRNSALRSKPVETQIVFESVLKPVLVLDKLEAEWVRISSASVRPHLCVFVYVCVCAGLIK